MIYDKMCSPSIFLIIFSYCASSPLLKKLCPILVPSRKRLGDLFSPCDRQKKMAKLTPEKVKLATDML